MSGRPCPRCGASSSERQHAASAGDEILWEVLHCASCSFTWRSTEEPEVIDPARRPAVFQFDVAEFDSG